MGSDAVANFMNKYRKCHDKKIIQTSCNNPKIVLNEYSFHFYYDTTLKVLLCIQRLSWICHTKLHDKQPLHQEYNCTIFGDVLCSLSAAIRIITTVLKLLRWGPCCHLSPQA